MPCWFKLSAQIQLAVCVVLPAYSHFFCFYMIKLTLLGPNVKGGDEIPCTEQMVGPNMLIEG